MGLTWDEGVTIKNFEPLTQTAETDVVVIGGGITGITTAYLLSEAGRKVILIEKDRLGWGATGATTAFLTQSLDTNFVDMKKMLGEDKAKAILDSHAEAINQFERIIQEENIACEFTHCPNYTYAFLAKDAAQLQEEATVGRRLGLPITFKHSSSLPFKNHGYLELSNQAKFHPLRYLQALVDLMTERGVKIYEKTEATEILENEMLTVTTPQAKIRAKQIVVTTYAPFDKALHFKKGQYTSYVMEVAIPANTIPEGIYEDTLDPYHYFRVDKQGDKDRLIIGGEDHRADIPIDASKNFQALADHVRELLTDIPYTVTRQWKGPILEPVDGFPFIGPLKNPHVFYATGFSGNGMTYSMIAATSITALIRNEQHPWATLYDAARTPRLKHLMTKGLDYLRILGGGVLKNTFKYGKQPETKKK